MEIGISSQYLAEVALNVAGFMAAGMIFMLVNSLFHGRRKRPAESSARSAASVLETSSARTADFSSLQPETEFINLGGMDESRPRPKNQPGIKGQYKSRNRREIMRLADELLTRLGDGTPESDRVTTAQRPLSSKQLNLQTAGRNA